MDTAIYRRDFEKICRAIAKELAAYLGKAVPSTPSIVKDKPTEKDDDKMKFTNSTTKAAVRDYIQQAVDKKLIDKSHLEKFDDGTLTGGDFEGLKIIIAQRSN